MLYGCSSPIENGYTDHVSYNIGDSLNLYLHSEKTVSDHTIALKDLSGKTINEYSTAIAPQHISNKKPYENGFGYQPNLSIKVPKLESGVYVFDKKIPVVVKPNRHYDILILYSSNTENAYCNSGGKSMYNYNSSDKITTTKASFLRPMGLPFHSTEFLKWIHTQSQYDIGYICDQDMDNYEVIKNAKLLIIPGHSEYWTRTARKNFDKFIDSGKNALIISGNTMWWQVRYSEDNTQMICYKSVKDDPISDPLLATSTWPDSILKYPTMTSIGVDFVHGGFGKDEDLGWDGFKIVNPESPLLKGSGLQMNDIIQLKSDEFDGADLSFTESKPKLNNPHGFYKYELIGYDLGSGRKNSNGAWIVMQKTPSSGVIINTPTTDWCRKEGMLKGDSKIIKHITINMIDLLLQEEKTAAFTD